MSPEPHFSRMACLHRANANMRTFNGCSGSGVMASFRVLGSVSNFEWGLTFQLALKKGWVCRRGKVGQFFSIRNWEINVFQMFMYSLEEYTYSIFRIFEVQRNSVRRKFFHGNQEQMLRFNWLSIAWDHSDTRVFVRFLSLRNPVLNGLVKIYVALFASLSDS